MQKRTKSRLVSLSFVFVCTGIALYSFFLFWKDLNRFTVRTDKTQIATISFKRNIAQRKFSDRVVWERIQQDMPLYDMDTLRIAQAAEAKIKFNNNTILDIDENTMLQISANKDGSINISVNGGNVVVDTTEVAPEELPLKLSLNNGSVVAVDSGSKIAATKDESSGENTVQLQAGNAKIQNGEMEETVEAGQTVQVKEDGTVQKRAVSVTSVASDLNLVKFDDEDSKDVTLSWTTSSEFEDKVVKIETSYDKDFKKIEKSFEATGKGAVVIENPEGKLYWRVYAEDKKEDVTAGKINVRTVNNVAAVAPVGKATIEYKKELPKINFAWNGNEYAEHYKLEVFEADNPANVVLTKNVKTESLTVDSLEKGDYAWKVTPYYEVNDIGYGKSSELLVLNVVQNEEIKPPLLSNPADNARVFRNGNSTVVSFAWKSDVKDAAYRVMISEREDFEEVLYVVETENTRHIHDFEKTVLDEGKYFWKVVRIENDGNETVRKESEVRSFDVALYDGDENKLLYPPKEYRIEKNQLKDVDFAWKLADPYKEECDSVIQISKTPDFDAILVENKTEEKNLSNVELPPGKYYWRVAAAEKQSGEIKKVSKSESFTVLSELAAPEFVYPASKSRNLVSTVNLIRVAWKKQSDADYYRIKLLDEFGNEIKQKASRTKENHYNFELSGLNQKEYRNFRATVEAVSEGTSESQMRISKPVEIVFSAKNPEEIRLHTPADSTVDGLAALRSPVKFVWSESEAEIGKSEFILRKKTADGSWKIVKRILDPKREILVDGLNAGNYQWTVTAESTGGISLTPKKTAYFSVSAIPYLETPVLLSPANGFVMGPSYLRKNRTIVFDWDSVPGATDYLFVLYQKGGNGSLRKVTEQKVSRSQYKFRNLKNLDIGKFQWQVTAFVHGKKNLEEQKSKTAESEFAIDFNLPSKVKTIDPGIQYGE